MRTFWNDFKAFISRGNVLDLAIAFILGTAFAAVIRSFATDILMPPIALVTGDTDFADRFILLSDPADSGPYATLAAAQSAGAVVISYGVFVNALVAFVLTALALFLVIRYVRKLGDLRRHEEMAAPPPAIKSCPFCKSKIDITATRCAFCTSDLSEQGAPSQ